MFNLFKTKKTEMLEINISVLEKKCDGLTKERFSLKEEVEDLKLKKKMSEEDIKHMVKMKEEKLDIEHQKKMQALELEKYKAIAEVKDEYRDKIEVRLEKEGTNIKEMYDQILERLPNITAKIKM